MTLLWSLAIAAIFILAFSLALDFERAIQIIVMVMFWASINKAMQ